MLPLTNPKVPSYNDSSFAVQAEIISSCSPPAFVQPVSHMQIFNFPLILYTKKMPFLKNNIICQYLWVSCPQLVALWLPPFPAYLRPLIPSFPFLHLLDLTPSSSSSQIFELFFFFSFFFLVERVTNSFGSPPFSLLYPRREIQRQSFRVCKISGSNQLTKETKKRSHEPLRRHEEPCPGRGLRRREEPALLPQAAPPGRPSPVPPERPLRRRHGFARPHPLKGRGQQSFGGVPAAAAVLRLAAAAGLEPGGPRPPVRHRLPAHAGVGGCGTGYAGAGGGMAYPAPSGAGCGTAYANHVATERGRVRPHQDPARCPRRGF